MDGCPFDTEVWATASVLNHEGWEDKPYSKLFCFDDPKLKPDERKGLELASQRSIPVLSINKYEGYQTEVYPIISIIREFKTNYFRNDISYMIALAIYNGYKSLFLWGVDQGPEYMYKVGKPYVTYWLGVATGRGVNWKLCPNSMLWMHSPQVSGVD
jgi:hypothetical protein